MTHRIRTAALGVHCALQTDDEILGRHLAEAFGNMAAAASTDRAGGPVHTTELEIVRSDKGWDLRCDGQHRSTTRSRSWTLTKAVQTVNRTVIDHSPLLLVHAGAVVRDGAAIVFPAAMESGKTTLVTGLVKAGYVYFTDEAAGFDWNSDIVRPFRKPLSLDQGSWHLFPELEPPADLELTTDALAQWQIAADRIRPQPALDRAPVRWVVFPKYVPNATTTLTPLTRAAALVELTATTFHFGRQPEAALDSLAEVVSAASCHRLIIGDLATAVQLVDELTST